MIVSAKLYKGGLDNCKLIEVFHLLKCMNILFWNVHKNKEINNLLSELILETNADIIGLAEYEDNVKMLLSLINKGESIYFEYPVIAYKRIKIISKIKPAKKHIGSEGQYYVIWQFPFMKYKLVNIAFVHMPVLLLEESDKMYIAGKLRESIEKFESKTNTTESIVVGDFNMNPFDKPIYSAGGLHAISDSKIALEMKRIVREEEMYYFYNPMWNLLGDMNAPTGSYFYRKSILDCLFWNAVDQVCIRPSLINRFDMDCLRYITTIGGKSILNNNIPNRKISDHLPLYFRLEEE